MPTSVAPRILLFGARPRTSAWVLTVGLIIAGLAVSLRLVAPALLLSFKFALFVAGVGFFLAVVAGRYGGGVFIAVLAAALPVFVFDTASTAVTEPLTLALVVYAAREATWYTLGVAGLVSGPLGYAVGAVTQFDYKEFRGQFRMSHEHYGALLAWVFLAAAVVMIWLTLPISATPSSIVAAPILVAGGLTVAIFFGYRTQEAPPAIVAGGIGGSAGLVLFVNGFSVATAGTGSLLVSFITVALIGFVIGVAFGLIGFVIGLAVRNESQLTAITLERH